MKLPTRNTFLFLIAVCFIIITTSCDPVDSKLAIINGTTDSLYFYVHPYKHPETYTWNIAYSSRPDSINKYEIYYKINDDACIPFDTVYRTTMGNWKSRIKDEKGLTVLFYKRDIEKLPLNQPLTEKDIFRRIDLTPSQVDSLNYIIKLK